MMDNPHDQNYLAINTIENSVAAAMPSAKACFVVSLSCLWCGTQNRKGLT
jgi:hypothetical protein